MNLRRARKDSHCSGRGQRVARFETLETRLVLTSVLYLDFGEFFPTGGLVMSADDLRQTFASDGLQGPNFTDDPASNFDSDTTIDGDTDLRFESLATLMDDLNYDYNGTGGAGDNDDYIQLRDSVLSLVQRYFAPFDVLVQLAPALANATSDAYLAGIRSTLMLGSNAVGEGDCWQFVTTVIRTDLNISLGEDRGVNGIAPGLDSGVSNARDDTALAFADVILGNTRDDPGDPFEAHLADTYLAYTAAHEAAHTFGLEHTREGALNSDTDILSDSDIMVAGADATNRENFGFFTRFDLEADNPPPATINNYEILADPDFLGVSAGGFAYVTGTGTHDRITISRTGPTTVSVTVEAFRDDTFTELLGNEIINALTVTSGLVIDAGDGDDLIAFVDFPDAIVYLRGMAGTDRVQVSNFGGTSVLYTPNAMSYEALDDSTAFGGTIGFFRASVAPAGLLFFDEFEPEGSVTIDTTARLEFTGTDEVDEIDVASIAVGVMVSGTVNGGTEFVPLIATQHRLGISLMGEDDFVDVAAGDQMFLGIYGEAGDDQYVVRLAGAGSSAVDIEDGVGSNLVDVILTGGADNVTIVPATVSNSGGVNHNVDVVSRADERVTLISGPAGKSFVATLVGRGGNDTFDVTPITQELSLRAVSQYIFLGGGGGDRLVLNDQRAVGDLSYEILADAPEFAGTGIGRVLRDGAPLFAFDGDVERVALNAGAGSNEFAVTPSETTEFVINANAPVKPLPPGVDGDFLEIEFAGTTGRKLIFTNRPAGNGRWEFANRQDVVFTSIEKFNFFDVLALGTDTGVASQPLVRVIDAETGEEVTAPFLAYAASYLQGVRVALGDMDGDGIPELVTAPGRNHTPTVKVFDILTTAELPDYRTEAYGPAFINGMMVAVGDVDGDGLNDIVTAPSRGPSEIKVFRNETGAADPIADAPFRWFHAFPETFIGGGSVALGDLNTATPGLEVVVGSGSGMRATVRAFDATMFPATTAALTATPVFREYLPFEDSFRGGVTVALGNAIGDDVFDVIVGAGPSGGGRIQILDGRFGGAPAPASSRTVQLFDDQGFHAPVRVALSDRDGDGVVEILAAQGTDGRSGNKVKRYNPVDDAIDELYQELDSRFTGLFLATPVRLRG